MCHNRTRTNVGRCRRRARERVRSAFRRWGAVTATTRRPRHGVVPVRSPRSLAARGALLAAAGLVAGTVVLAPHAGAANRSGRRTPAAGRDAATAARTLAADLGSRTAGSYLDASGRLVVTVTDDGAMAAVRAAGAVPKRVSRSASALTGATASLHRLARVSGTAWAVDPAANQVVVSVDPSVTGSRLARVRAAVRRLGGAARIEYLSRRFVPTASGGDAITTGRVRCSLGFNVKRGGQSFFPTAGHCGPQGTTWADRDGRLLGTTEAASFPGNDFSLIRYADESANTDQQGSVRLADDSTQDITE